MAGAALERVSSLLKAGTNTPEVSFRRAAVRVYSAESPSETMVQLTEQQSACTGMIFPRRSLAHWVTQDTERGLAAKRGLKGQKGKKRERLMAMASNRVDFPAPLSPTNTQSPS